MYFLRSPDRRILTIPASNVLSDVAEQPAKISYSFTSKVADTVVLPANKKAQGAV